MSICQFCGQVNEDNAKFCTECGAPLPAQVNTVPAAADAAAPAPAAAPAAAPASVPEAAPAAMPDPAFSAAPDPIPTAAPDPIPAAAPEAFAAATSAGYTQQAPFAQTTAAAPRAATKQEFLELPQNVKLKKDLKTTAIICYVCAGITLLVLCLLLKNPASLLDVLVLVGLGLGIQLKQSKVCAVILLAFAAVGAIAGLVSRGRLTGYLVILAGIYAVRTTFAIDKKWKEYCQTTSM